MRRHPAPNQKTLFADHAETLPLPTVEERISHLPAEIRNLAKTILCEQQGLRRMLHDIISFRRIDVKIEDTMEKEKYESIVSDLLTEMNGLMRENQFEEIADRVEQIRQPIRDAIKDRKFHREIAMNSIHTARKRFQQKRERTVSTSESESSSQGEDLV